jgi:hypothetical protein
LLLAGCGGKDDSKGSTALGSGTGSSSLAKVSKASFEKVKDGMSDKEVTEILGPPTASAEFDMKAMKDILKGGTAGTKIDIPEIPGLGMPKMTLKNWDDGETLYEVVFQEGKVVGKETASKKEKVTKENADKIKVGMTRDEVEAILGKGKHEAGAKIEGAEGSVTVWEGSDGVISVIFTNDKVTATGGWQKK